MDTLTAFPLALFADASAASDAMRSYITPLLGTLVGLASVAVVFFLVYGGIRYMTSTGNPEKLDHAKSVIKNALIGLVIVIAAGTLTAILSQAYNGSAGAPPSSVPELAAIEPEDTSGGLVDVLIDAIVGLLKVIIQSVASPFIDALTYFTEGTPLMAENPSVFNLWLAMVAIADVLFILVVALLGFRIMSFSALGMEETELKHLLPQLALIFLLINSSIFAIDAVIGLSNAMITALMAGFPEMTVWNSLTSIVEESGGLGLAALLIMVVFVILAVMLLVYYVLRLVVLYIGAVLAPLVFLVWLLPAFRDFAVTAMKVYLMTIFVLFVHVVILMLASSMFAGLTTDTGDLNPLMAMLVGLATILALLKTQGVMSQMSYVSLGPRTARKLGGQLSNAISHYGGNKIRSVREARHASKQQSASSSNATSSRTASRVNSAAGAPLKKKPKTDSTKAVPTPKPNSRAKAAKQPQTRVAPRIGKEDKK